MKTAVIFADNVKQIVLTPENKDEKYALSLITSNDDIELLVQNGKMHDYGYSMEPQQRPFTATVSECMGGFLRIYEDEESRILVLKPKKKKK